MTVYLCSSQIGKIVLDRFYTVMLQAYLNKLHRCQCYFTGKPHTMVVHTSVPYGIKHLEVNKEDLVEDMMANLEKALPWLPNRQDLIIKPHKWRYSQVL